MVLCKNSRESIEHLLLHCEEVETEMWSVILQLFCVDWAIPRNLRVLGSWRGQFGNCTALHL
jgi:hypothetical protein